MNKESLMRKNLIETEEGWEAKICEGSQASSILNDHRKIMSKIGMAAMAEDSADRVSEKLIHKLSSDQAPVAEVNFSIQSTTVGETEHH